jgi:hypothetical protein
LLIPQGRSQSVKSQGRGRVRDRIGITWTHLPAKRQAKSSVLLTIRSRYFHATPYLTTGPEPGCQIAAPIDRPSAQVVDDIRWNS